MGDVVVTRADREVGVSTFCGECWQELAPPSLRRWIDDPQHEPRKVPPQVIAIADAAARVRIAAERAGYERGVREERERCAGIAEREASACDHHAKALVGDKSRVRVAKMHACAAGQNRAVAAYIRAQKEGT